jgi:hypothetical protein
VIGPPEDEPLSAAGVRGRCQMSAPANSVQLQLALRNLPGGGMDDAVLSRKHTAAERLLERTIFASRWLLAPFYAGLGISLLVLLIKFSQKKAMLVANAFSSTSSEIIAGVLSRIDISLIASLVLMVMGKLRKFRLSLRSRRPQIQTVLDGSRRFRRPEA